jgi:hypothetical protein
MSHKCRCAPRRCAPSDQPVAHAAYVDDPDAEALISRLSVRHEDIAATLDLALEILGEDLHELYRRADHSIRRLINQAIFNALFVCDETITNAEFAEPFAALRALHDAIRALPASAGSLAGRQRRQRCPTNAKGPGPCRDREPFRVGSISEHLVRPSGLEPPRRTISTRPSTLRVYQFRHGRRRGEYSQGSRLPRTGDPCGTCIRPGPALQCEHMFVAGPQPPRTGGTQAWI